LKNKIDITYKYKREVLPFKKGTKYVHSPKVPVVIKDPSTGKVTAFAHDFLIDTGASISIINSKYESFIRNIDSVDQLRIKYGGGKDRWLNIYELIFIIKGQEMEVKVAYDDQLPFLLLGHYGFFENLTYQLFNSNTKKSRLVKS